MTQNQLAYLQLKENRLHNRETERLTQMSNEETARHNVKSETQVDFTNLENLRSHRANEELTKVNYGEIHRSNLVKEQQNRLSLDELYRHNLSQEMLTKYSNKTQRKNVRETIRHDKAMEKLNKKGLGIQKQQADTARLVSDRNYSVGLGNLDVQRKQQQTAADLGWANQYLQDYTQRANLAENARHNTENERIAENYNNARIVQGWTDSSTKQSQLANDKAKVQAEMVKASNELLKTKDQQKRTKIIERQEKWQYVMDIINVLQKGASNKTQRAKMLFDVIKSVK